MPDPVQRVLGLLAAGVTLPLLCAMGLAVKLETPGPLIYGAERVGAGGRPFTCFKLRTMTWQPAAAGTAVTAAHDPRLTKVGRFLRRFRLDELPQFWNVARGEMRLVGPRPEAPAFVDPDQPFHRLVFTAKPGITGLTQLFFTGEAARLDGPDPEREYREVILPEKVRLDAAYLRHRSTALDLWILAQTPRAIFGRRPRLPADLAADLPELAPGAAA